MKYLIVAVFLVAPSVASARVDYAIDLTAPEHHSGEVSIDFPRTSGKFLDVKMPAWRTGRYQILNLANGVRGFAARDEQGRALKWEKIDKSTWRVHLARPTAIKIGYELYGRELGLRTRHIDDSHAYLDASAAFMYADRYRADDITVSLAVPTGWTSVSGMASPGPNRFVAKNWDVLVDSPIETGLHKARKFTEGGRDYEVVIWGDGNYNADQVATDLRKIVAQAASIWSSYPFQRYLFIIHATDGAGGATEHLNSTVIQIPRYSFQPRTVYLNFLSTASHEFIHTWNVKSYRSAGLVPYDYQRENYSDLLWVMEGSTDYFADHLLLRAGLMDRGEYLDGLAAAIDTYLRTPGARVQSVAEASFDEWISVGGDRARNAQAGIYTEGAMVSWLIDIALLEQSGGKLSYRNVHEELNRRFGSTRIGFTAADMKKVLRDLTGASWEGWWAANVQAPASIDFQRLLSPVGLKLTGADGPKAAWAGWAGDPADGATRLRLVEKGGPAWTAGFTPDDIIVAFDGKRVSGTRFDTALAEYKPAAKVRVTFFRRDQIGEKELIVGELAKGPLKIVPVEAPTEAQKALFQRWLLIPYPAAGAK